MSLKDNWYIAAEARELKRKPIGLELYGERLVLFRDEKGNPAALEDRCAHRNLELSRGRTIDGCIECQYHGWRYDGAGALRVVPSLGKNACLPNHRVRSFPAVEQNGFIWVFLGAAVPQALPFHFPHYGEDSWTTFRMKTRFEASVEACLENFLDCPHTVFVHKGWFRSHDTRELAAVVQGKSNSVEARFRGEPISKSVVSRLFFPKGRELKHTDRFEMPNISRVHYDCGIRNRGLHGHDIPFRPHRRARAFALRALITAHHSAGRGRLARADPANSPVRRAAILSRRNRSARTQNCRSAPLRGA